MGRSMSPIPACFVKFQWFIWTISCSRGEYKRKSFCNPMYRATMNSWLAPAAPKCPKLWQYFAEISLLFKLTSLSPNFSQSSFICVKSRTVVPHNDATFSISTTFPCSELNLNWKNHCGQTIYCTLKTMDGYNNGKWDLLQEREGLNESPVAWLYL